MLFPVGGREEQDPFVVYLGVGLVQEAFQVVEQIVGLLLVGGNQQVTAVLLCGRESGADGCGNGACHAVQMDTVDTSCKGILQFLDETRVFVDVGQ